MARPRNNKKHLALAAEELLRSLARFIDLAGDAMEGRRATESASVGATRLTEAGDAAKPKRGPGQGNRKPRSAASRAAQGAKMRAYWAKWRVTKGATDGPKTSGPKRTEMAEPSARKTGSAWASMTPAQRAERVSKMQAGRARRPSTSGPEAVAVPSPMGESSLLTD